ncbi:MAG: hypothetical protein IT371_15995 [Deltaproteobacteria bacterium]|nr:hypothetical protein [Deltaproteobacteria bacterium]
MRSRLMGLALGLVGLTAVAGGCGGGTTINPVPNLLGTWDWDFSGVIGPGARQLTYYSDAPKLWAAADISLDQKAWCRMYLGWSVVNPESDTKFTWSYTVNADACGEKKGATGTVKMDMNTTVSPVTMNAVKAGMENLPPLKVVKCGTDPLVETVCGKSPGLGKPAAPQ